MTIVKGIVATIGRTVYEMVTGLESDVINNTRKRVTLNEAGMDVLTREVLECARSTNDNLNKIVDIVQSTSDFYDTESGAQYRAKFQELSNSFQNIVMNIETIAYGLKEAKIKFANQKEEAIARLSNAEANISIGSK